VELVEGRRGRGHHPDSKGTRPPPDFFRASCAQDRDRAFQAKRRREYKPSRAKGIASAPACAFCWNGLRIPATWWWARMRIGAGFRIRSGRAAGNNLTCSQCRTVGAGKQGVRVDGAFC